MTWKSPALFEVFQKHFPYLEEHRPICILTKTTKNPRSMNIDVSTFDPNSMLQMDFSFLKINIICRFPLTFVSICSDTSYPFGFP